MTAPANQTAITEAVAILKENSQATAAITGGLASQIRNEIAVRLKEDLTWTQTTPSRDWKRKTTRAKAPTWVICAPS